MKITNYKLQIANRSGRLQRHLFGFFVMVLTLNMSVAPALADEFSDKSTALSNLNKKIEQQETQLKQLSKKKATLQNQIDILDKQIEVSGLQLEALAGQIAQTNITMKGINKDLVAAEIDIFEKKKSLKEAVRQAYVKQQVGVLDVMIGSRDLSDFMSQMEYLSTIESRITNGIGVLHDLNDNLADKKGELEAADKQLKSLQAAEQLQKSSLDSQIVGKQNILSDTTLTEAEYQKQLAAAIAEQRALQNEIAQLAKNTPRNRLNQGKYSLNWPIPSRLVTAGFRDGDYVKRFGIAHNAIDIATPQGTPIKAPSDAYVLKIKFDGSTAYSYIMLDHGNGMVTVYGHVSGVNVAVGQFVPAGGVIGRTGGTPRTTGAGAMTTGPHLHFEVWLNGEARNPLSYLG